MALPTKIGKYLIKFEAGHGAMGIVYRAEDPRLHRPVALKVMSQSVAGDPELLDRFYREAESAGQLRHPNIVTIYDIDEADGTPFIAMEFLEGEPLDKIIAARKALHVDKKLDIVAQTCKGLHYAHLRGVVHRDVKPANIFVENDGLVKIVDFGIARVGESHRTRTGTILGTPMYMSPEQVQGQTVDGRSDVFSVGVILYELLTFRNAFAAQDTMAVLYKIINESPPPVSTLVANCPPGLDAIVARALAKNREERYQNGEDLAFDLLQMADRLKRHMIEVYTQEGERSFAAGNLTVAKEVLQKALEIDSSHDLAKDLFAKVQDQIYVRERNQKIEQMLRQAKADLQGDQFEEAIALLDEILKLDPGHAEAQRDKAFAVDRQERARNITQNLERAEKLMADGDLRGAQAPLQAVLALDPEHAAAAEMMESVSEALAEQERLQEARERVAAARSHLEEKSFDEALRLLEEANQLDPRNIEIESMMRLVRSSREKEERRRLLEQRLANIQETLNREEFEATLALCEEALGEFPEHPQLLKLHAQATRLFEARQKRQRVEEQIQAAREFLQKNQFSSAVTLLERAMETAPDDPRLASFLTTVKETQERVRIETLRKEAIRTANEQLRAKNFVAAIDTLEKALARCGQSAEIAEVLQFAREQQAEHERQERLRQVLSRAQNSLRQENFEEAIQSLERARQELSAPEIETLLATAREQWNKFEQQREEILARARQLLKDGEAGKAVASLDASPRTYFKNEKFQQTYAQCREALKRDTAIRSAIDQIQKSLVGGDLAHAEALLRQALQAYPGEPKLVDWQRRLKEEQMRARRAERAKLLDDAKVSLGRMQYQEAVQLLTSVEWDSAELPELASEARKLLEEAQRRESEAAQQQAQTVILTSSPLPASSDAKPQAYPAGPGREAPAVTGPPHGVAPPPAVPPGRKTIPGTRPAAPHVSGVIPAPARPPVVVEPVPAAKRTPIAIWVGMGVLVLALVGFGAWRLIVGGSQPAGRAELTAVPWAEVVSVQTKDGKSLDKKGTTPLELALPPGEYVVELKNDQAIGKVNFVVKSGEATQVNYTFPQVSVNALVDELVSKY